LFISPEVQRKMISDWAELHDVKVVRWWEELDQSGAKLQRPMFMELELQVPTTVAGAGVAGLAHAKPRQRSATWLMTAAVIGRAYPRGGSQNLATEGAWRAAGGGVASHAPDAADPTTTSGDPYGR
jgi:hypothetical protein